MICHLERKTKAGLMPSEGILPQRPGYASPPAHPDLRVDGDVPRTAGQSGETVSPLAAPE
jgi:hypothetical protein